MLSFFKLIRWQNLLILVLAQYLLRYLLIIPYLESMPEGFVPQLSHTDFFIMSMATILLAAAGYVINDYFDTQTDILNRPESVIVGNKIKRRSAILLHVILNIAGIGLGFWVSVNIGMWKLGNIYILISALLWFYSASFKRRFLIGNFIVALMTALAVLLPAMYEIPPLRTMYADWLSLSNKSFENIFFIGAGFALFAFLTTLAREIIKDTEDFEGDRAFGRRSLPVVFGITSVKYAVIAINILVILLLAIVYFKYLLCLQTFEDACLKYDYYSAAYILLFGILPQVYLSYKVSKADTKEDWRKASRYAKLAMLFGILYTILAYLRFNYFV